MSLSSSSQDHLLAKYIIVSGGVLSGLGKGIIASSVGLILKDLGFRVTSVKLDPYVNIDCGLMSPYEHGECFVLQDGTEVDLDFGNYERFIDCELASENSITTGKVYNSVIQKERDGVYLGRTVQIVPHITGEIRERIFTAVNRSRAQICIVELGGTIGDIEGMPFVEALRELGSVVGSSSCCNIHVSLVPTVPTPSGDQKTKPTQSSVRALRSAGIAPDIVICRSLAPLDASARRKLAAFCLSGRDAERRVLSCYNVPDVLQVPEVLLEQQIDDLLLERLGFSSSYKSHLNRDPIPEWIAMLRKMDEIKRGIEDGSVETVRIGVVGKYIETEDCYFSVLKALEHAGTCLSCGVDIVLLNADSVMNEDETTFDRLSSCDGVLVPGGFGARGVGGFQVGVIEFARNVLGFEGANSTEFDPESPYPVVIRMVDETDIRGASMRLGARISVFRDLDCKLATAYRDASLDPSAIVERHRHRYEVNPEHREGIQTAGLRFVATDESEDRMEAFELEDHPFYCAVQYHPEFLSNPRRASPCFVAFVQAALDNRRQRQRGEQEAEEIGE